MNVAGTKLGAVAMTAISLMLARCTGSIPSSATTTRTNAAIQIAARTQARVTPTTVTGADGYLWMLGTYPCATGTCPVLMRSTDGGKSFVRVGTPPAGMYGIEFANREDGYGLAQLTPSGGPSLYQTTDGGTLWRRVPSLGVITSSVVTANGRAFVAAYQDCSKTKCRSLDLASSAVTSDSWTLKPFPLSRQALNYPDYYEVGLTAFDTKLWVAVTSAIGKTVLFVSNDGGHNVSVLPTEGLGGLRCDLSATSPKVLWGHCITGLFGYFVRSSDGGPTFLNLRPPGEYATNSNDYLALSDNEALFDVAGIQDTLITKNGGRTFVRLPEAPQGVGVADIVPLSATDWFAQGSSGLWRTSNGGRSWQPVKAPSVTVPAQRLFVATGLFRVSALVPAAEFPTKFYPDATEYPGNVSGCPDLAGVSTTTQLSRTGLAKLLDQLGGSRNDAVEASDPNYWPFILLNNGDWAHFQSVPPGQLVITRLLGSGYAGLAQHCGKAVVSRLWLGQLCNGLSPFVVKGQCREPALAAEVLFLDRRGRWLVVYTYG